MQFSTLCLEMGILQKKVAAACGAVTDALLIIHGSTMLPSILNKPLGGAPFKKTWYYLRIN